MECVTSLGGDELLRNELRWRGGEKTGRIRRDPQRVLRSSSQRSRRSRKGSGVPRSRTSDPLCRCYREDKCRVDHDSATGFSNTEVLGDLGKGKLSR